LIDGEDEEGREICPSAGSAFKSRKVVGLDLGRTGRRSEKGKRRRVRSSKEGGTT